MYKNFIALRRSGFALRSKRVMGQRGKKCVSEHFESIETHFFFNIFREREAQNARERSEQDASEKYTAPDCDTSNNDLLVYIIDKVVSNIELQCLCSHTSLAHSLRLRVSFPFFSNNDF